MYPVLPNHIMHFLSETFLLLVMNLIRCMGQNPQLDMCTPGAKSSKIVEDVVKKVEANLGHSNNLLRRTAFVESKDGNDSNTYRPGYHGGIWQVDKAGFDDTQDVSSHPKLKEHFVKIKDAFGIDWTKVKYQDLRKPLYSAIAARLIYLNVKKPIPPSRRLDKQGSYWKKYYNKNGAGTLMKFAADVLSCDKSAGTYGNCRKGEKIFKNLAAIAHTISPGGAHGTGPNLYGICGRPAASSKGYSYSQAMQDSGITWDENTLDKFLKDPSGYIPGNAMAFAGISSAKDRRDLIAYLCGRC